MSQVSPSEDVPGEGRQLRGVPKSAGGGGSGGDLDQAIAVLAARVDEEFRISERLDSKIRQAFALAAGFYAVIQTVAFGSFAQVEVSSAERAVILLGAVVAGGLLARVAYRAFTSEELRDETDVRPAAIVRWANEAGDDPEFVRVRLISNLKEVAEARSAQNEERGQKYDTVVGAAKWALIIAGVELIVAIAARL